MTPLPPLEKSEHIESEDWEDHNFDLSYLSDKKQKGQRRDPRNSPKGKTVHQVRQDLSKILTKPTTVQESEPVKRFKLKSNSVRDRMHPVGSLMLRFDGDGIAMFRESDLEEVKAHMARRPGRFSILDEEKTEPKKKDPQKALAAAKEALVTAKEEKPETKTEEKKPEEKSKQETAPTKKKKEHKTTKKSKTTKKKEEDSSSDDK